MEQGHKERLKAFGWHLWLGVFAVAFVVSSIAPFNRLVWALEVTPALIALGLLLLTRRIFPLTPLSYQLILLFCLILMLGGHYSFSRVPLFDWLAAELDWQRNHFDRLVHFLQGFVPAVAVREFVIRRQLINGRFWQMLWVVAFCLAVSAGYELIEWRIALLLDVEREVFLAEQGDVWDTQADMLMALLGACAAMATLSRTQDRQITLLASQPDLGGGQNVGKG
ncbi:DUF2238 domain-containing protein [Maricurvus nonylphenolicus]|uniref:DUF2238 domain-containing protein n=1 Tax=Maricurvus nonylphenolicus TaxID=1008307 RepID=UPI0036F3AFFD